MLRSSLALLALTALLAAPMALAQNPTLTVSAAPTAVSLGADGTADLAVTVRDTSSSSPGDKTATLTAPTMPGWTFTIAPATGTVNGGSVVFTVTIDAVPGAATAPQNGNAVFTGRLTSTVNNGLTATAQSQPVALTFVPAAIPPPPAAAKDYTVLLASSAVLLVAIGAGVGLYFMQARSVSLIPAEASKALTSGVGGSFNVKIENRSGKARTVELRIDQVPARWFAALTFPKVVLRAHESTTVALFVKVPEDAQKGATGRVVVRARPQGRFPWLVETSVVATVAEAGGSRTVAIPAPMPESAQGSLATATG